jgi:PhzF family phenazine biosynthesis protein
MKLPIYQIDAFTDKVFKGNPAAVCPLESWIPKNLMQKIAMENNLAETAFFVPTSQGFEIKWFTPTVEIDLCGHATLATAHVLFEYLGYKADVIRFESNSGELLVRKEKDLLLLDFPTAQFEEIEAPDELLEALVVDPEEVFKGFDYMLVLESEEEVMSVQPNFLRLAEIPTRGIIITAQGESVDFVSRFFAPRAGILEDPVTGSSHTLLIPYWAKTLGKNELTARQLSPRQGELFCKYLGNRVEIGGKARTYLVGEIDVE